MNTDIRPPTRVSKACDRCRGQKKRCDFERPCRHCIHARTACTTDAPPVSKKPRLSKDIDSPTRPKDKDLQAPSPHTRTYGGQSSMSDSTSNSSPQAYENAGSAAVMWDTSKTSKPNDTQALPGFDADSALDITRKIFRFQKSQAFKSRVTSAIPGGGGREINGTNSANHPPAPLIPIADIIGFELPSYEVCNQLLETYFSTVHWFSLVVYEPKFRGRYNAIMVSGLASRSDHGFLLLLLMVLIMGCWYTPKHKTEHLGLLVNDMEALRTRMLKVVQGGFMELMDEDCLEFVQICALLGSFYLYHGRPRSSFSILGAATKTSQAMGLHRDSDLGWSFQDGEERKRVWWTIYTWDRFATITYGRPLGINDKDCNVHMPSDVLESVHFLPGLEATQICLSTYQHRLNLVYKIASPLLEDIYGIRTPRNVDTFAELQRMVAVANEALLKWRQDLPFHLSFDHLDDLTPESSMEQKLHSLQALSLHLTYENLIIVLHRPMLAGRGHAEGSTELAAMSPNLPDDIREIGFQRCLRSALRISNLQRKQNLLHLARTTHLVSFLGMNLFTASVVLFICALSDTLSDTAQEAKRGLKRTLQMQKAQSNHASLSMQCSTILEDLVQLILKKEMEEMFDLSNAESTAPGYGQQHNDVSSGREQLLTQRDPQENPAVMCSTTGEELNPGGSQFRQSLQTLQQVFHGNNLPQYQGNVESGVGSWDDFTGYVPNEENIYPGRVPSSNNMGVSDNNFTRVEDLSQIWLWDLNDFNF